MIAHAYLAAMLFVAALGGAAEEVLEPDYDLLVSAADALADVEELGVVLVTQDTPQVEQLVDANALRTQVEKILEEAGLECLKSEQVGTRPKFVVHVEGVGLPECGKYVYRVQVALHRLMPLTRQRNRLIRTEAWQVRPVMKAVPQSEAGEAIVEQVLMQTRAFVGKWEAARELLQRIGTGGRISDGLPAASPARAGPHDLHEVSGSPFVASRSSEVFHRADCRWARNISESNLVGYATREHAVRAGKRPCKSCKP